jgi:hypothetical protein
LFLGQFLRWLFATERIRAHGHFEDLPAHPFLELQDPDREWRGVCIRRSRRDLDQSCSAAMLRQWVGMAGPSRPMASLLLLPCCSAPRSSRLHSACAGRNGTPRRPVSGRDRPSRVHTTTPAPHGAIGRRHGRGRKSMAAWDARGSCIPHRPRRPINCDVSPARRRSRHCKPDNYNGDGLRLDRVVVWRRFLPAPRKYSNFVL